MSQYRIDKFLADMGCGTRSEVKNYIKKGRVTVNGSVINLPDMKIDTETDKISFDGKDLSYVEYEYYMLNKPQGVVSATEDKKDRTVIDLITARNRKDLFPVGRLDKDTEGLLLITNDGQLAHNLLSPKKHVDKVYYAEVDGIVTPEHEEEFAKGIVLEDGTLTRPAVLKVLEKGCTLRTHRNDMEQDIDGVTGSRVELTIREGKFHQVKRMFEACEMSVIYLKRLQMGTLVLDDSLAPGNYRELSVDEITRLKGEEH